MEIVFNKPYLSGKELEYIKQAIESGHLSGNGRFTKSCQKFFEDRFGFGKCLLTSSCTDALEMAAILCEVAPGDEVIVPSFTFVSTANAFALRGASIVFADSRADRPCLDEESLEAMITPRTKVIVPVHYGGVACDMDMIMTLANKHGIFIVEDAAQSIDSYYKGKPLGSFGHLACFSFHETKNIISGEGGMLVVNDKRFFGRSEIIWEKGTNRAAFFNGEVDKYGWVDIGSSFLPSELMSAFLLSQLENLEVIQKRRLEIWNQYYKELESFQNTGCIQLPRIPPAATNNGHLFYILCRTVEERSKLILFLREKGISAVFHYQSLHQSAFNQNKGPLPALPRSDYYSDCLLRLPFYFELTMDHVTYITDCIKEFYA